MEHYMRREVFMDFILYQYTQINKSRPFRVEAVIAYFARHGETTHCGDVSGRSAGYVLCNSGFPLFCSGDSPY